MKKNLAIIGASYLQLPLIMKAKEMGLTTHVFAWKTNDVGEKAADYFYPISIVEKERILEVCRDIGICGICSIATDLGAITVNYVAQMLGLTGNSIECTQKSTNKHLMRMAFERNGDPSPKSILADESTNLKNLPLSYPVIVKPTDRSGSRGIFKVERFEVLALAVQLATEQSFEKKALIEEFAEGQEYSVEGISYRGKHRILAVTQKYTTGAPHFIETGHLEPAPINENLHRKVIAVVTHALDSLGIANSASHTEIDDQENIKLIEIGDRMGGDCIGSDLVYYSTGIDYVRAVIQLACGMEPDLSVVRAPCAVMVKYMISIEDVKIMESVRNTESFIKMVDFSPENIGHTTDSSNRVGCYIIKV